MCELVNKSRDVAVTQRSVTRLVMKNLSRLTCSMSACGEWTKMEGFSLGDDSRQSWASVALAL